MKAFSFMELKKILRFILDAAMKIPEALAQRGKKRPVTVLAERPHSFLGKPTGVAVSIYDRTSPFHEELAEAIDAHLAVVDPKQWAYAQRPRFIPDADPRL